MKGFLKKDKSKQKKTNLTKPSKQQIINQAFKFHSQGNISEATKYYKYFISKGFLDYRVFSNYGVILRDLGKFKEAKLCQQKAIELKPNYPIAYSNLGGILKDLGKLQEAELTSRKAIELNPNNAELYYNLGSILKDRGKLQEAVSFQQKAITLKPDYPQAYLNLGGLLRDLGKWQEAELTTRKAIELKPDSPNAHRDLSICLYLLGDLNSALKSIIKANSLDNKDIINKLLINIFQSEKIEKQKKICHTSNFKNKILGSNYLIFNLPVEAKLISTLYTLQSRDQEIYQGPTYGDAQGSDYKLFEKNDSNIKKIKEKLIKIAKNSINSEIFISESFFTIFRSGGGLISHDHLGEIDKINGLNIASKKFSLVYYLDVGDQNCEKPGILKLENPNKDILPTDGLVIIFPAKRKHSVFYKGQKDRIIIGMNFYKI